MAEDTQAQEDELLALASIYDEQIFSTSDEGDHPVGQFSASLELPQPFFIKTSKQGKDGATTEGCVPIQYLPPIVLYFQLPEDYPSQSSPSFTLSCKWLSLKQLSSVCKKLDEIWIENQGMEILYLWNSFLKDEVVAFLEIQSPLDLSNIVSSKRHKLSRGASVGSEASKFSAGAESQSQAPIPQPQGAHSVESDSGKSSHQSEAADIDHVDCVRSQDTCAGSGMIQSGGTGSTHDSRAIQDIACQELLCAALIEHDKAQKEYVFQMTLFSCQVCFMEKIGKQCIQFSGCDHVYCKDCMKGYFQVQISEGNVRSLTCPSEKCESQAYPAQVKDLVGNELFSRYDRLLLQSSLDTMADIMYCPRQMCGCAVVLDQDSNLGSCPGCHLVFCIFCRLVYHGVSPCKIKADEVKKLREQYVNATVEEKKQMERRFGRRSMQTIVEDSYSQDWLDEYSKRCPSCGTYIQKIDGCNKMTCTKCRCYFCWLCGNVLSKNNPYHHFNNPQSDCFNRLFHGVVVTGDDDDDVDFDDLLQHM